MHAYALSEIDCTKSLDKSESYLYFLLTLTAYNTNELEEIICWGGWLFSDKKQGGLVEHVKC